MGCHCEERSNDDLSSQYSVFCSLHLHPIQHPINDNSGYGNIKPNWKCNFSDPNVLIKPASERTVKRYERQRKNRHGKNSVGSQDKKVNGTNPAVMGKGRSPMMVMIIYIGN